VGRLEYLRVVGIDDFALGALGWRDFFPAGVVVPNSLLLRLMMMEDAGELLGVSRAEPASDCSVRVERTVETESRSLRVDETSSAMMSISLISCSRSKTFCLTSC
jgi:hypothetical protein